MGRNTSVSLGNHFEDFVDKMEAGAGHRLPVEEESKIVALKKAINEGLDSGLTKEF